jgi:nucleoside-triphosphatase THEP1
MKPDSATPPPTIAAIRSYDGVDDLIAGFARSLINCGWRVRGLLQEVCETGGRCSVSLIDLAQGARYPISQELGKFSASCRVDPAGIAEASAVMRRAAAEGADLVIFNRFAGLEASGQGLAAEMLTIMAEGIPLLTTVPEKYFAAWQTFTGGLFTTLEPRLDVLENWFFGIFPAQQTAVRGQPKNGGWQPPC